MEFARLARRLEELHRAHASHMDFAWVYIREAHPGDELPVPEGAQGPLHQAKSLAERKARAIQAAQCLGLSMPVYVDDLQNRASKRLKAWPDRYWIVHPSGKTLVQGHPGPHGLSAPTIAGLEAYVAALVPAARRLANPPR